MDRVKLSKLQVNYVHDRGYYTSNNSVKNTEVTLMFQNLKRAKTLKLYYKSFEFIIIRFTARQKTMTIRLKYLGLAVGYHSVVSWLKPVSANQ